jgi:hypothetical protein
MTHCLVVAQDISLSSADPAHSSVGDTGSLNEKNAIPMKDTVRNANFNM